MSAPKHQANALNPRQAAEIICQLPGRVTEGVLERRGLIEKLRSALSLKFYKSAQEITEHPRSLRRAALEMQAIGFSPEQIQKLKQMTYTSISQNLDKGKLPKKLNPAPISFVNDDRAFVGTAGRHYLDEPVRNNIFTDETETLACDAIESRLKWEAERNPALLQPAKPKPYTA